MRKLLCFLGIKMDPLLQAAEDIKLFHSQAICSVCGDEKWPNSPFCRGCSIKLIRAKLMRRLKELLAANTHAKDLSECAAYLFYYDLCRDYLTCKKKGI